LGSLKQTNNIIGGYFSCYLKQNNNKINENIIFREKTKTTSSMPMLCLRSRQTLLSNLRMCAISLNTTSAFKKHNLWPYTDKSITFYQNSLRSVSLKKPYSAVINPNFFSEIFIKAGLTKQTFYWYGIFIFFEPFSSIFD